MSRVMIEDLIDQYKHTFRILYQEIERFQEDEWLKGFSSFQVPVKQAMHIFDCLDFYFQGHLVVEYQWGYRFGGGWWELADSQLPTRDDVLNYAWELESVVISQLETKDDFDLSEPSPIQFEWARTQLGLYIYALKHTLHHHGELAALSVFHGNDGGRWE
jgi:hypothetical protein